MTTLARVAWPGLRLLILPLAWLAWLPAAVLMLGGTGALLLVAMHADGRSIDLVLALAMASAAAVIFKTRRAILRRRG